MRVYSFPARSNFMSATRGASQCEQGSSDAHNMAKRDCIRARGSDERKRQTRLLFLVCSASRITRRRSWYENPSFLIAWTFNSSLKYILSPTWTFQCVTIRYNSFQHLNALNKVSRTWRDFSRKIHSIEFFRTIIYIDIDSELLLIS